MKYGSVCSGIEAASMAWRGLGWSPSFFSEIEAFPRAVLAHHYPDVPLHGDFTTIESGRYDRIDLLVGGTPCQSFSVAGLRGGLDDDRGNLALEYLRLADRLRPRWLVWENVPGVLSSRSHDAPEEIPPGDDLAPGCEREVVEEYEADERADFACFLDGLRQLGYGFAYRVLDAQFFGVAQRRRRVFVVGYLGDWRRAAAVLFERHSLQGHPAPRREAGKDLAPTLSSRPSGGGGLGTDFDLDGGCVVTAPTLRAGGNATGGHRPYGTDVDTCDSLVVAHAIQAGALRQNPASGPDGVGVQAGLAYTLEARTEVQAVAFAQNSRDEVRFQGGDGQIVGALAAEPGMKQTTYVAFALRGREGGAAAELGGEVSNALRTPGGGASVPMVAGPTVRRLTPRECERLQGFPDDFTLIPWRKGMAPDGPRYKALGNSMAMPVMRWIGERIAMVDAL